MKLALLLILLISTKTWALSIPKSYPLFVGGTTALVLGTQGAVYKSLVQTELAGWSDKKTGTTIKLEDQCHVQMEMHLAGTHRQNMLLIGVVNSSESPIVVKYKDIKFTYDGKITRYPGFTNYLSDNELNRGWWQISWVPFPTKKEFKSLKRIQIEVPVLNEKSGEVCLVTTEFDKAKDIPKESLSYSVMDIFLDVGPSLAQYGNIKELGKPDTLTSLELNFYPRPEHGFGMIFSSESGFSGGNNQKLQSAFNNNSNYKASLVYFGLQYLYRHYFNERLFLTFGIGPGIQGISDEHRNSRDNDIKDNFAIADKLMLNWTFYQLNTYSAARIDFYIGAGLAHFWTPSSSLKGQDVSGQRVSSLFRLGMGF